jgi:serine/threonine protein kinase
MSDILLKGRYRHLSELGRGEHTIAYKALDTLLDRTVVVKTLREPYASNVEYVEHFHRGARAMSAVAHANLVAIYDMGSDRDLHYVVTEYVEGKSLESALSEEPPLDVEEAVRVAMAVCQGVGAAHRAGYIHGHLSPRNILLSGSGHVKVSDFQALESPAASQAEESPRSAHSALYLSPEQLMGRRATPASDVYSIGVIAYEMLAGRPPFLGDDFDEIAEQHIRREPVPIRQLNPEIPDSLRAVVHTALSKTSGSRYRTANELAMALGDYQSGSSRAEFLAHLPPDEPPESSAGQDRAIPYESRPAPAVQRPEPSPETRGPVLDWAGCVLGLVAVVAVLGLVPLWLAVFLRYFG